jgi:hypothetical protein
LHAFALLVAYARSLVAYFGRLRPGIDTSSGTQHSLSQLTVKGWGFPGAVKVIVREII